MGKNSKKRTKNKRRPTISLCMIVKNEEACLGRCLKSVCDHVDEIIIVDTGSTDRTVEIAKSYGARIYHHPWENDFSKHRNQSISYATGDWIFILDADEELFPEDGSALRDVAGKGKADYYHCRFYDVNRDGSVRGVFYHIRLFRNGMGMGYEQKVHNQLRFRGKEAFSAIRIRHYGYDLTPEQMEAKHIRTTTLLKEMLVNDPEDVYCIFQLSSSYSMHREHDRAVEYGEMALEIMRRKKLRNPFFTNAFFIVAHGYHALGKLENAERVSLEALDYFPMHLDMCHILASVYFEKRDLQRCRCMYERCLRIYESLEKNPSLIGNIYCHSLTIKDRTYFRLACTDFLEKDFEGADQYFWKGFEESGKCLEHAENICRFYLEQRMDEKALLWLKVTYETGLSEGSDPAIFQERKALYLKIGKDLLQQGDLKAAADCLHKAEDAGLSADEQLEKRLLQTQLYWQVEATDDFIQSLESLMRTLGMNTSLCLHSIDDTGRIVYDIAEEFCRRKQWHFAETTRQLAIQVAPAQFDHGKFDRLLLSASPPAISLCMIVKNEEACLGRCLKSVCDHVDEIIIVDTGSTDRTVEIAKSYGARIYHHPWENDFSKHRNQSISYATGDWIFILDADEELFPEDGSALRDVAGKGKADYYHCRFYDVNRDGSVRGVFYHIRLFRNGMGMGYEQKVHNQLRFRGKEAFSAIRIRHYGYDLTPEQMEAKHIRTTTLLKEMLVNDPEDVYCIFQLSASYSMHCEHDRAVEYGEMALEIMRRKKLRNPFFTNAFFIVAHGYHTLGQLENAERVCLEALDYFPKHLDMCHILASVYFKRRSLNQCRTISQRYLSIYEEFGKNPTLMGSFCCHRFAKRNEIFFGLACIHFLEKDFETADAFFRKAFEDSGSRMEHAENICRFYLEQRMDEKALPWLKVTYEIGLSEGSDPAIFQERKALYLKIGKDLLQQGDLKAAADCLHKAEDAGLSTDEQLEKRLLQTQLYWQLEATDDFIQSLESLMRTLGMNTNFCLHSTDDTGRIVYDIAEEFCRRKQWHFAEAALRLAIQIAPVIFDHGKFNRLLADA
jgi:glycosyltransferase involved in cell wall biosynthesis